MPAAAADPDKRSLRAAQGGSANPMVISVINSLIAARRAAARTSEFQTGINVGMNDDSGVDPGSRGHSYSSVSA